jgi:hypothetical protein
MAYFDKDLDFPLWLPEAFSEELISAMALEALVALVEAEDSQAIEGESCGFIVEGWFGPFLLGPVSRFLRGRC